MPSRETLQIEKSSQPREQEPLSPQERAAQRLQEISRETATLLQKIPAPERPEKEQAITRDFQTLTHKLSQPETQEKPGQFTDLQQAILKLKLTRHYQPARGQGKEPSALDLNTLADALIETPKFLQKEKGSLRRLLEIHEQKILQQIAEQRKARAEKTGQKELNPWETLYSSSSGKYYLARLLNMPHLEKESEYMKHCVGTSDSYCNRMKRGEIEILSFRQVPPNQPPAEISRRPANHHYRIPSQDRRDCPNEKSRRSISPKRRPLLPRRPGYPQKTSHLSQ